MPDYLVAINVELTPETSSAQTVTTSSNVAGYIESALTATETLGTSISAAVSQASTADAAATSTVNDITTVQGDIATIVTDTATVLADTGTTLTDLDLAADNTSTGVAFLLGAGISYCSTTHIFSGAMTQSSTITSAAGDAMVTLLNTAWAAAVAANSAAATAHSFASNTATTDATALSNQGAAMAGAVGTLETEVDALTTATIITDLQDAQGSNLPDGVAVYIQANTSLCTSQGEFNGALLSALNFANDLDLF